MWRIVPGPRSDSTKFGCAYVDLEARPTQDLWELWKSWLKYLYNLQNCFNNYKDNISIIFLGGKKKINVPEGSFHIPCISPVAWDYLLSKANASLIPCNDIRTSPGSPLKLYDSIRNKCPVFAQLDLEGYGDEVERLEVGKAIDFKQQLSARNEIIIQLSNKNSYYINEKFKAAEWENRLREWFI